MERTLDPVLAALLATLEPQLDSLGFRLVSETYHHSAFGSATLEYHRRGARLRFTWDGKDRWAWMNLAAQPTSAFPKPDTYVNLDAGYVDPTALSPRLSTIDQASARGHELLDRLGVALASISKRAV